MTRPPEELRSRWLMFQLWNAGMLPLADFSRVSIDDVDLAARAFEFIRRA